MILGNAQQQLTESEEIYSKISDLVKKNQPERIQIKNIRLQNQRLKALLQQPLQNIQSIDYDRLKILSNKYQQLVNEFDYAKATRISKGDFLAKLRRIMDVSEVHENHISQVRGFESRPPQHLSGSNQSSSSAGGNGILKYGSRKNSQQNMFRVPSVANQSILHAETGTFANYNKKDDIGSRNKMIHKTSSEHREITSPGVPKLSNMNPINERLITEISQIKMVPPSDREQRYFNSGMIGPPIASLQTIQPMKQAIQKMISHDDVYTPIAGLDEIKGFPRPNEGYPNQYFPIGIQENQYRQMKSSNSIKSRNSQKGGISDPEAFMSYNEGNIYKQNIQNLFRKAEILKRDNSFKSQMRTSRQRSKSKSKSKMKSTQRIRDLSDKEEMINKLASQNIQLRRQLQQNNHKIVTSQNKKQTFPEGTLEFQKYVISNELLKQQNKQIYSKLKQLEEVLEELSRQNFIYKDQGRSQPLSHRQQPLQKYKGNESYSPRSVQFYQQPKSRVDPVSSQRRLPTPKHPLIELPPELGQLIDTESYRSTPRVDYEYQYKEIHYGAEYQGVVGELQKSQRSKGAANFPLPTYLQNLAQPPSMIPLGMKVKTLQNQPRRSPSFNQHRDENQILMRDQQDRDLSEPMPNIFKKTSFGSRNSVDGKEVPDYAPLPFNNENIGGNNTNNDIQYFTANNISAESNFQRFQIQQNQDREEFYNQKNRNKEADINDKFVDESGRQYQDFPQMQSNFLSQQNMSSPNPLRQNSIQKSFETFKVVEQQSQKNIIQNRSVSNNSIERPENYTNNNRSSLLRNKVAFYKKSLVLMKDDPNFELAFKRSDLSRQLDTVRIIFYINNKEQYPQAVSFKYDYNQRHYTIRQGDRLVKVPGMSQGREQLVIRNINQNETHKFIVCHLTVGTTSVDFIVPSGAPIASQQNSSVVIQPDKQFSPQFLSTLIPIVHKNPEQYLQFMKGQKPYHGQCIIHDSEGVMGVGLQWISGSLRISCPSKYVNQISWTLSSADI